MPELPDVELYLEGLRRHLTGETIRRVVIKSPFVLRTIQPEIDSLQGARVVDFSRIGKRIVWHLDQDRYIVFHLMISGRFHMRKPGALPRTKVELAAFQFDTKTLMLTEAGTKKRASIHLVGNSGGLQAFHRGGLDVLTCTATAFAERLTRSSRTVKLALMDPSTFDGIGNAYSDEILHRAKMSPFQRTRSLTPSPIEQLICAAHQVLTEWIDRLQNQLGGKFPEKVTAFRPEMAVHGKFGQDCPECQSRIQRIVFSEKEWNYCPVCQTAGKLLADRSLSRLLRDEWPKMADDA